ncbi:MAG: cyclic lactone autoinducer peptide [Ruminococcus sp.]|nr:cyclic lactone autoinducer peptide [Ruminococcus sp.]MCR5542176.1 cyclic lactone autoinducer peptide [Ruminococcus sp.]
MKTLKKLKVRSGSALASLALKVGVSTNKQACIFWYNQPKEPKGIDKFRK